MNAIGIEVVGDGSLTDHFDLFVSTLGYESRSSYLARQGLIDSTRNVALAFPEENYAAYSSNRDFLLATGFEVLPDGKAALEAAIRSALASSPRNPSAGLSLLVDISSMSRPMLADIVYLLSQSHECENVLVTFAYLPAYFVKSDVEHSPVSVTQPVTPQYAGWTSNPDLPISAVVGLGYERDLALGTIEFLEPSAAWAFIPTGEDRRFDDSVKQANRDLKEVLGQERTFEYQVDSPVRVFAVLESLVYGLLQSSRPILIPFGPKIFTLCCLLVARIYNPNVTVWRVSGETYSRPGDREASGKIVTLKVKFARSSTFY